MPAASLIPTLHGSPPCRGAPLRLPLWRRSRPQDCPTHFPTLPSRRLSRVFAGSEPEVAAAEPSAAEDLPPACTPPTPEGQLAKEPSSRLESIPPQRLKELRRLGLAIKDRIKLGRRGVAEGFIAQVFNRWKTSEVARLYCHGKPAANMKLLARQLEERTGGVVIQKAGGTVFLYRAEPWPRQPPPLPQEPEEGDIAGAEREGAAAAAAGGTGQQTAEAP